MAYFPRGTGGGNAGGGLLLRRPPDVYAAANLAACRTARNNYFAANAAALAAFQRSQFLAVILDPAGDDNSVWQTYAPGEEGNAYNAAKWLDRTGTVRGPAAAATEASVTLLELEVFIADGDGAVQGDALTYRSADGDFNVAWPRSIDTDGHIGFILPQDRALLAIYVNSAVERSADFVADPGNPRRYIRKNPWRRANSVSQGLVRTVPA